MSVIPLLHAHISDVLWQRAILWDEGQEDWWVSMQHACLPSSRSSIECAPQTNPEGSISVVYGAAKVIFDWLGVGENVGIHVRHPPDDLHCGESA